MGEVFKNKHDCINNWLRNKDSTSKASRRSLNSYSRTADRFFHEFNPDVHPSDVTLWDVEEYVLDLNDREVAQNTKRRYVESLSAFYTWAMKRPRFENITGNPAAVVLEELPKKKMPRPDTATWETGKLIVQNIPDPRDKAAAVLMAKTGARVQEVLDVTKDDLMLEEGFIRFRDRKGGTTTVNPIDDEMVKVLRRLMTVNTNDSKYVFTSIRGDRVAKERIRIAVRRGAVRAGVMDDVDENRWHHKFTPHYYRTIFTSLMRNSGMPDRFTRYLRGDGDQETMDLYTKIPQEKVQQQYLEHIKSLDVYGSRGGENRLLEDTRSTR